MGRLRAMSDYESLRNARISENQARLASLGLEKKVGELRAIVSPAKSAKTPVRKYPRKSVYGCTSLRRSDRLKGKSVDPKSELHSLRRSDRLKGKFGDPISSQEESKPRRLFSKGEGEEGEEKRRANAPFVNVDVSELRRLSPDVLARRCDSKTRGSIYDPVIGICCHFCRQKKLCGEEDCKRCGNLDIDQPCLGKTDCSVCHSTNGVLCRACLKVRYGEDMEEVQRNKEWMCPHCIEEKGINPFWICNSSLCLKKRKMVPTGIAIFKAREEGYKSVAHLIMDQLQRAAKGKR
ncbi:PREDICTED: cell division cycle-associated 7-like protein isoform X2 [Nelumbo nucifera]|uniref:Cell division cycle-associated 7-like protein isoform X2 n=1 Tax=Nelumbo nucifera TaxID=4432 RepID=A0A1U8B3R7_NELNU|nr:PREDICTED: cell division cycle-associated 7-like protein isoform X2 [Nelumbo nucifera]